MGHWYLASTHLPRLLHGRTYTCEDIQTLSHVPYQVSIFLHYSVSQRVLMQKLTVLSSTKMMDTPFQGDLCGFIRPPGLNLLTSAAIHFSWRMTSTCTWAARGHVLCVNLKLYYVGKLTFPVGLTKWSWNSSMSSQCMNCPSVDMSGWGIMQSRYFSNWRLVVSMLRHRTLSTYQLTPPGHLSGCPVECLPEGRHSSSCLGSLFFFSLSSVLYIMLPRREVRGFAMWAKPLMNLLH